MSDSDAIAVLLVAVIAAVLVAAAADDEAYTPVRDATHPAHPDYAYRLN